MSSFPQKQWGWCSEHDPVHVKWLPKNSHTVWFNLKNVLFSQQVRDFVSQLPQSLCKPAWGVSLLVDKLYQPPTKISHFYRCLIYPSFMFMSHIWDLSWQLVLVISVNSPEGYRTGQKFWNTLIFPVIYCSSSHPSPTNRSKWYKGKWLKTKLTPNWKLMCTYEKAFFRDNMG